MLSVSSGGRENKLIETPHRIIKLLLLIPPSGQRLIQALTRVGVTANILNDSDTHELEVLGPKRGGGVEASTLRVARR